MANLIKTLKKGVDFIFPRTTASAVFDSSNRTVQAVITMLESGKLSINQGAENAGKYLAVGDDGFITLVDAPIPSPRLPAEYQEVEWIESKEYVIETDTPTIDSGIYGVFSAEMVLEIHPKSGVTNTPLIGQSTSGGLWFGSTNDGHFNIGGGQTLSTSDATQKNTVIWERTDTAGKLTLGGESIERSGSQSNDHFYLFSAGASLNGNYYGVIKMYSAKISQNGSVVRNFVPCYRKSDSEIGMYDLVTKAFFATAVTGTFTKGADVVY